MPSWARKSARATRECGSSSSPTPVWPTPEVARLPQRPSMRREIRDSLTGRRIVPLTTDPAHHWHLSASDTPFTPAGDFLLFLSDRGGGPHPELFRLEMRTGALEPVMD